MSQLVEERERVFVTVTPVQSEDRGDSWTSSFDKCALDILNIPTHYTEPKQT